MNHKNIIFSLRERSHIGCKIFFNEPFDKNRHCLICKNELTGAFHIRSNGNFCSGCGNIIFNGFQKNEYHYQQTFW